MQHGNLFVSTSLQYAHHRHRTMQYPFLVDVLLFYRCVLNSEGWSSQQRSLMS